MASCDTFQRLFAMINLKELEHSFNGWMQAVAQKLMVKLSALMAKPFAAAAARGCQKDIVKAMREKEAEYVLAVKGNQGIS